MGSKKIVVLAGFTLFLSALLPAEYISAARYDGWESFTSTAEVRYIDYFDDSLQVITSGGWLKIDPLTMGMKKVTNVDGPGTNDLYYIMKDSSSSVWLAGYGRLVRFYNGGYSPFLFNDRDDNLLTLYSLADDDDRLWVGTSKGLAFFDKNIDGGQIEDFYYRFGELDPEPAVYDVLTIGDTIWIATSGGLAVAEKSVPNLLKSFVNWTSFNSTGFSELQGDTINTLSCYHNNIYAGTTRNLFRLSIVGSDTDFVSIIPSDTVSVKHMTVANDSLYIFTDGGLFVHSDNITTEINISSLPDNDYTSGRVVGGVYWLGFQESGLYYYSDGTSSKYDDGSLPGNNVASLSADSKGRVVGAFLKDGAAVFDTAGWSVLNINVRDGVTSVLLDDYGNAWAATWGNGLFSVNEDSIGHYNQTNSTLRGVLEGPKYVVVNSLAGTSDYLFISNYRALDGNPVSVADLKDGTGWVSFGLEDGITTDRIVSIDCYGQTFAVGTENSGVFYYYFGSDPFSKSDDSAVNFREDNSWLGSNNVNVVKFDNSGILWVGTKYGLSQYDPGIERFVNVTLPIEFGPEVTELVFDRRGNIWIGARNGLARYDASSHSVEVFDILNSGLTDNIISALMINPATNDLWVGTPSGICKLESSIGKPTSNVEEVIAFPNPFVIRGEGEALAFNYDGDATVRLYTAAGELVREISVNVSWDGTNQEGHKVASGVYLFLLTAKDGSIGRGKILLIRK
jgi:ligand-binding sensor domain-containing protein